MNFFKLYIGDYQRDTGTLTLAEHGAYLLMLQHLYATEKPLPTGRELHRLLRAESKAERDAIDRVTARFWHETDGGLVNDRALNEIRKGIAQREINQQIGKRGGRPRKTESVIEPETDSVIKYEPNRNPNHSQTPEVNPLSEQAAAVPQPVSREKPPAAASSPADPITARAIELTVLLRQRGAALQASDPRIRGWAERGVSDAQAMTALETANERRASKANPQPVNAGLLDSILADTVRETGPPWSQRPRQTRRTIHDEREAVSFALTGRKPNHDRPIANAERDITGECSRVA